MKVLRWILCAIGILVMGGEVCAADQVMLKLQYPEGRIARYKISIAWIILAIRPR